MSVNIESGVFQCFSCGARGNIAKLVQRIEGLPTQYHAQEWLLTRYGRFSLADTPEEPLGISFGSAPAQSWVGPGVEILERYAFRHPYHEQRGILAQWQRPLDVGYDPATKAITFGWRTRQGDLVTVKKRRVMNKQFWYEPKVPPGKKGSLLYGLHLVVRRGEQQVWITEAEIDAILLWQSGRPAVALGGSKMSSSQARELTLSGIQSVVLCCDNDQAGRLAHESVRQQLMRQAPGISVLECHWPDANAKDVGELADLNGLAPITKTLSFHN